MDAVIRPAEITDVDTLIALSKRTIRASYTSFLGEKAVQEYLASGAVEDYFHESLPRCFVIEEDGAIAGVGSYKGLAVDLMMIDAERHGRGLGTRLLDHLESLLFAQSAELTLESFANNEHANRFYRKRGWISADANNFAETDIPMIKMRKRRP